MRRCARGRAGEEVPEGGYQGAYIEDVARALGLDPDAPADEWRARGAAAMVDDIKQHARAVPGELRPRSSSSARCTRTARWHGPSRRCAPAATPTRRTAPCGCARPTWATTRTGCSCAPTARRPTSPATWATSSSKLERGFDVAVYVLGSDHHGYIGRLKAGAAALGYDPDRIDVQLYQFVKIVEGGRAVSASQAPRHGADARRAARRDRRRRRPLRARAALARPGDRARPRPVGGRRTPRTRSTTASTPTPARRPSSASAPKAEATARRRAGARSRPRSSW